MTDALARLRAGLDRDEAIAKAAVGKRGRAAGDTAQHWQWERTDTDAVVDTGRGPIPGSLYPDEPEGLHQYDMSLRTAEQYRSGATFDHLLPDFALPSVEEPTAGAATHIAAFDPARVLRQASKLREAAELLDDALNGSGPEPDLRAVCTELAELLADIYTKEK